MQGDALLPMLHTKICAQDGFICPFRIRSEYRFKATLPKPNFYDEFISAVPIEIGDICQLQGMTMFDIHDIILSPTEGDRSCCKTVQITMQDLYRPVTILIEKNGKGPYIILGPFSFDNRPVSVFFRSWMVGRKYILISAVPVLVSFEALYEMRNGIPHSGISKQLS